MYASGLAAMPCRTRMKLLLRGLLWLYMLEFGFMVASLEPGFLDFDNLPDTNFSCVGKVIGGYYADLETSCQMFHVCTIGQLDEPMDIRFLCLNGTVFDQETRVCERIDEVDCSKSEQFYSLNLELYGNTQPPTLEESAETESPETPHKATTTTTTTTTSTARPTPAHTQRQRFIITTTTPAAPQLHFGARPPDIRFNPEQFKVTLSSAGPPSIRANVNANANASPSASPHSANANVHLPGDGKPVSFQTFSDHNKRVIVTTHTTVYRSEKQPVPHVASGAISPPPPTKVDDYDAELADSTEDSYSYGYHSAQHQPESLKLAAYRSQAEALPKTYHFRPSPTLDDGYKPSTYRSVFHPATNDPLKVGYHRGAPTTYRNHYGYFSQGPLKQAVEKQRGAVPPLPTLPPLTFSSPAPFSLRRHVEAKRFVEHRTQRQQEQPPQSSHHHRIQQQQQQQASQQHLVHHHQPPRIVISASASVSDASGRKFNYSLGTIGDTRLFGHAPQSYDDYKEEDVGLDPFYHDVPKIRLKRQAPEFYPSDPAYSPIAQGASPQDEDRGAVPLGDAGEKEAIDVLRFLFNWYNNYEKNTPNTVASIPIRSETITEINDALTSNIAPPDDQQKEFFYEDFDGNQKAQHDYAGLSPRNDYEKPYLSLQLLKPPFDPELTPNRISIVDDAPTMSTGTASTSASTTTSTTTLPSAQSERDQYVDYVDDNYEPLAYQGQGQQHANAAKLAKGVKDHARNDYQMFKESFALNYPFSQHTTNEVLKHAQDQPPPAAVDTGLKSFNKAERNYSISDDYVDDNYEAVVYQTPTTPETVTTLKVPLIEPLLVNDNYNTKGATYYYDRYNQNLEQASIVTPNYPTANTNNMLLLQNIPQNGEYGEDHNNEDQVRVNGNTGKEYPVYARTQYEVTQQYEQNMTEVPRVSTENYQELLGILGITTRAPLEPQPTASTTVATPRNHGRGKTRFSLKDVAGVGDEIIFTRKPTKPPLTTPLVPHQRVATLSEITTSEPPSQTTTEGFQYSITIIPNTSTVPITAIAVEATTQPVTVTTEEAQTTQEDSDARTSSYVKLGEDIADTTLTTALDLTTEEVSTMSDREPSEKDHHHTSMDLQTFIETVEGTTNSVAAIGSGVSGGSAGGVPTTIDDDHPSTTETFAEATTVDSEELKVTTSLIETAAPTVTTVGVASSTTTTTTTPAPRTSRRRSKSRHRHPATPPQAPTESTSATTSSGPEFPSSVTFSTSTLSTLPTVPSSPAPVATTSLPRKPTLNEEIVGAIKQQASSAPHESRKLEFNINAYTANLAYRAKTTPLTLLPAAPPVDATQPPAVRSAQPTMGDRRLLPTTPLARATAVNVRKQVKHRRYTAFNCVDRPVNRFYSDSRDCRLFHYCTRGFTKTQYLDMKFVCDRGTFFDDEQLVCTRAKPARCA